MHQPRKWRLSGGVQRALAFATFAGFLFSLAAAAQVIPTRLGDLDADGQPTVLDLVRLISHINGTNLLSAPLRPYGDINEDGVINTNDVILLQDAILGLSSLPNPYAAPVVSAPVASTNGTNLLITGVSRPNRTIYVQGGQGVFSAVADSNGNFSVLVTLQTNRVNSLFLTASNGTFTAGTPQPLKIIQDSQPPSVFIDFPTNGQTLFTSNTVIAGRVGDMLSGFMGLNVWVQSESSEGAPAFGVRRLDGAFPLEQPKGVGMVAEAPNPKLRQAAALQSPPGLPANINVGIGNNGTFERVVPLALGTNIVTVTASDVHGNTTIREIRVIRGQVTGPRIVALSGDMQATNVHRRLSEPITIRVTQADGSTPFANRLVSFQVIRSDGRLLPVNTNAVANPSVLTNDITSTPYGIMHLDLFTDANGEARAWWTLGGAAGCGGDRVCVTSAGNSNNAYFCASAKARPASQINIGTGNNQKSEVGSQVSEPLRAWVSDSCNGVEGMPVMFRVVSGGGKVNGQDATIVLTTRTGHAEVPFTLGPQPGKNLIEATYAGNTGLPATFIAYGVLRDPAQLTSFSGLVLDNTSRPIGGALCVLTVGGVNFETYTDAQGQFRFANTPAGPAHLHVDGLVATNLSGQLIPQGSYPALAFTPVLIPNAPNALPMPVLLPKLNPNNARSWSGTNDLELTCEGMDGLNMLVKAGSMRKPDGTLVTPANPAILALNQVHHDSVPMPMPDGASPAFAWTLQPGGATFDPPIQIAYPNMSGLPAGGIAYFLSFIHDTERFEIIASGHVTDDSATIVTDPGAGLTVAGWGCNCPPYSVTGNCDRMCGPTGPQPFRPAGGSSNCAGECAGTECDDGDPCTVNDSCQVHLGPRPVCRGDRIEITSVMAMVDGMMMSTKCTNTDFSFTATAMSRNCSTVLYEWDFGDGMASMSQNPTHKYTAAGEYMVTVTAKCPQCPSAQGQATVTAKAVQVGLMVQAATLTLCTTNTLTADLTPASAMASDYRFEIRRAASASWFTLNSGAAKEYKWPAKVAGTFKLRVTATLPGGQCISEEKDAEIQFPTYAMIEGDADVRAQTDAAWASMLAATMPNNRREEGFWILFNSMTCKYEFGATILGPVVDTNNTASVDIGPRPADNPAVPDPNASAVYSVCSFHTHTPMTYRSGTRAVGPSAADQSTDSMVDMVPGIVYDYVESPAGSGTIPGGHPLMDPAQRYMSGLARRPTP